MSRPKGQPRFDVKVRELPGGRDGFKVCAWSRSRKEDLGCVEVGRSHSGETHNVEWSWVLTDMRRRRIATKLYLRAAQEACKRGAPLCSDTQRSVMSNTLWEKQHRKGRATWVPRSSRRWLSWLGGRFCLTCPAPRSLARPGG